MNREEFLKKLHPAITHINASDKMTEEQLDAINAMVDKVYNMSTEELKALGVEQKRYREYKESIAKESENYPLLKKCKGQFNELMMRDFFDRGFTPISACNAMVEAT